MSVINFDFNMSRSREPFVLIVDDDEALCSLLSTMVHTKAAKVECAHSIAESESIIKPDHIPEVVFLDQWLPDGSGIDYAGQLKALDKKIKIIMVTGDDDPSLRSRALAEELFGFLEKPFSFLKISELLDKALRKTRFPLIGRFIAH
jgi:DNA-binding NtrC family response regulator